MSHTVTVRVEIRDLDALKAAAERLGARVLGHGTHQLYQGPVTGYAIQLPNWRYPIVIAGDQVAYDDYNGAWGRASDLDRLREEYAIEVAYRAAQAQGWYCERADGALRIYHPDGAVLRVDAQGTVAVECGAGASCVEISAPIEQALGRAQERVLAPEYYDVQARVVVREGE
jgi:hypothetical protein